MNISEVKAAYRIDPCLDDEMSGWLIDEVDRLTAALSVAKNAESGMKKRAVDTAFGVKCEDTPLHAEWNDACDQIANTINKLALQS